MEWFEKDSKALQNILNNFDPKNSGHINFKTLCSYICLLSSNIPTEIELNEYRSNLEKFVVDGYIVKQKFLQVYLKMI